MKEYIASKNRYGMSLVRVAMIAMLALLLFSFSSECVDAVASVTLKNVAFPTIQTQRSFNVKGVVTSSKKVTKAKLGVVDSSGNWAIESTRTIGGKSVSITKFNKHLSFKSLKPGEYYYKCNLYHNSGYTVAFKKKFIVYSVDNEGIDIPSSIAYGDNISNAGSIFFNPRMDEITVGLKNENGWVKNHHQTFKFDKSRTKFSLSSIDKNVFETEGMEPGAYTFCAEVKVDDFSVDVAKHSFTLTKEAKIDTKSVTYPSELSPGKRFSIKGTVKSSAKITSLKLGIVNSKGKWEKSYTVKPNKYSYDLSKIDSKIKFGTLSAGSYRYKCIVNYAGRSSIAFNHQFYVMSFTMSGIKHPSVLFKGKSFNLVGILKSKPSMSEITIGVTKDGKWLKDFYVKTTKSTTEYNIAKSADSKLHFGKLPVGEYTYRCTAKILGHTKTCFDYKFEVSDDATFSLSGVLYPPKELGVGKSFSIGGTITSNVDMSKIRIGITDSDGEWLVYRDSSPKSKTFNVASVDKYITFGTLPTGTYFYRIDITVGDKQYTKVKHSYKVVRSDKVISKDTVDDRIEQLLENLDGKYFTTDGKKATSNVDSRCNVDNVLAQNSTVRRLINKYKGGSEPDSTSLLPMHYALDYGTTLARGYSCCGFANFAEWYIFADSCSSDVSTVTLQKKVACNYTNAKKYLKRGDIIRFTGSWSSGHSAIVLSVNSSGVEILDCNSTYYNLGDSKASRICSYRLGYSKIDYMSVSRATSSPYL